MAGERLPLASRCADFFLELIALGLKRVSFETAARTGVLLGRVWHGFIRIRKKTVLQNIQRVFPAEEETFHRQIAIESFERVGAGFMEILRMRHMSDAEIGNSVEVSGMAHYEKAASMGRGVIVITGHMGNFDLLACSRASAGIPLAIVSRRLSAGGLNRFWMRVRNRFGVVVFGDTDARKILSWLRSGNVLGLVMDQRIGQERGGVQVPFCGHLVWTSTAPVKLFRRTGAPLLPVRIRRKPGVGHEICIEAVFDTTDEEGQMLDDIIILNTINQRLESWIRESPADWMWLHRRFRSR